MEMSKLKILAITDVHYIGIANHTCRFSQRKCNIALKLIEQVFENVNFEDIDVIALIGDLTDNGKADGALEDLMEIKKLACEKNKPVIAVRGNHDVDAATFMNVFEDTNEILEVNRYQFIHFHDEYEDNDVCHRNWDEMEKVFGKSKQGIPKIVFQHNPIYPKIEAKYPFNITGYDKMTEYYAQKNVILSVSGHYHKGTSLVTEKGVSYVTVPALCEDPFCYGIIDIQDGKIDYIPCSLVSMP